MQELIIEIAGWIGTVLVLLAYFMLIAFKKITEDSKSYNIMNLLGAVLIIINSSYHMAYPSVGLNIAWSIIAIYGLIKGLRILRK